MLNKETNLDAIVFGAGIGGSHQTPIDGGQRPGISTGDARRIAELEHEVQELQHSNEILRANFAGDRVLDIKVLPPTAGMGTAGYGSNAGIVAPSWRGPPGAIRWAETQLPEIPGTPQPMAEFRALGPLEAVVAGRMVDLGAPKQRALLALLVSQVGQPVAVDVMVEELWTGRPPPSAITSLQAYIANLRRVLEPHRAPRMPATVLRTSGRGYLLDSRVVEVDVQRFGERAPAGWRAMGRGDPQQALGEFEAGLALWRGQAYVEVANATYVVPEIMRLEELRLSVIEGRCAALLGVGAREVAVAELEAFTQAHPLREYCCELLTLALYQAGRQADALATLRSNQKRLAEELGIDPNRALQRLEREILNQAPALDWRPPSATVPATDRPTSLQAPLSWLPGRT